MCIIGVFHKHLVYTTNTNHHTSIAFMNSVVGRGVPDWVNSWIESDTSEIATNNGSSPLSNLTVTFVLELFGLGSNSSGGNYDVVEGNILSNYSDLFLFLEPFLILGGLNSLLLQCFLKDGGFNIEKVYSNRRRDVNLRYLLLNIHQHPGCLFDYYRFPMESQIFKHHVLFYL